MKFSLIFITETSNNFLKTRFWKEKSVESMVTFEGLPLNSSMISFQNNVICCVHPTSDKLTLGPTTQVTLVYNEIYIIFIQQMLYCI